MVTRTRAPLRFLLIIRVPNKEAAMHTRTPVHMVPASPHIYQNTKIVVILQEPARPRAHWPFGPRWILVGGRGSCTVLSRCQHNVKILEAESCCGWTLQRMVRGNMRPGTNAPERTLLVFWAFVSGRTLPYM